MKKRISILLIFGAAALLALTSCETKDDFKTYPYVMMSQPTVSFAENAGEVQVDVVALQDDGNTVTDVQFALIDGTGSNAAVNGIDYSLVSPADGILKFSGSNTASITLRISDTNVGIYTGTKRFSIKLTDASNGYTVGGAYTTTVSITDVDKNPDSDSIFGHYICSAQVYSGNQAKPVDSVWDAYIYEHPDNPDLLLIDGLSSAAGAQYESTGSRLYTAWGYLQNEDTEIVIPTQIGEWDGLVYVGWTPVTDYDGESVYFTRDFPDFVLTYQEEISSWVSEGLGLFLFGWEDPDDMDSVVGFYDYFQFPFVMYKADD